ncbi:hypothetical protein Trydic_g7753 [Trypoxylus dichotomus]
MLETERTRLIEGAYHWYETNEADLLDWKSFQERFEKIFVTKESTAVKWRKMISRTQRRDESIDSYFHEKVRLCTDLNLEIKEIKEQVLIGLWSKPMCDALFSEKHFSTEQLLYDLREYSGMENERTTRNQANRTDKSRYTGLPYKRNSDSMPQTEDKREPLQAKPIRILQVPYVTK